MYFSNPKRVRLLISYLLRKPWNSFRYLRNCYFSNSPLEKGLPWWSYESIDWTKKVLNSNTLVFEWGTGGSTIFLSKLAGRVISVENDDKWFRQVTQELERKSVKNVSVRLEEIELDDQNQFENCDYFNALEEKYDFIIIDGEDNFGPEMKWSARESCFQRAQKWINSGGFILVDDSWRYSKIKDFSKAKKILSFKSIGPCRKGITSTDIHCY